MSDPIPKLAPQVSEEFLVKVNDFIQMANRIEKRFDTAHAQMAMLHAFSRYGAHHYVSTVKADSAEERVAFANYLGHQVANMLLSNVAQLSGPLPGAAADGADAAATE